MKTKMRHLGAIPAIPAAFVLAAAIACSDADAPTGPSPVSAGATVTAMAARTATPDILSAMEAALQDEYHAWFVYQGVLADFGDVWPFVNIVQAEQRHADAVAHLFTNRGMTVPESEWTLDNVPRFATLSQACAAAAQAERDNIALYDAHLGLALPNDVGNVFTNNRQASLSSHLPAFEGCAGN